MSQTIETKQGNSLSLLLVFPDSYTPTQAQNISLYFGEYEAATLSGNTIVPVPSQPRQFRVQFSSSLMRNFEGRLPIEIAVDDSVLGVKRNIEPIWLVCVGSKNRFNNSSFNTATDATIQLGITSAGVTANVTLATIYRGYSAYELAVQNGYEGTELEWLESLKSNSVSVAVGAMAEGDVITHGLGGLVKAYFYDSNNIEDETVKFRYNNANSVTADLSFLDGLFGSTVAGTVYFLKLTSNTVTATNVADNAVITHDLNGVVKGFFFDSDNIQDDTVRFHYLTNGSVTIKTGGNTVTGTIYFVKLK